LDKTQQTLISKIRNVWKFLIPFPRNTLIPCSENISWSLKTSFWKKNCPTNTKMVMKIIKTKGFAWFWDFLHGCPKTIKFRK
jgi:hypothetical protein